MKNDQNDAPLLTSNFELRTSNFNRLYAAVLIELAAIVVILYAFSLHFQ